MAKVEELLKAQFLDAIDEDYIVEQKEYMREYDGIPLKKLLQHVKEKYAKMDDETHRKIMEEFEQAPDMSLPIDKYFAKQEKCKRLVFSTDNPIKDEDMVLLLNRHMGAVPELSKKTVKFRKKQKSDKTWKKAKEYYREALDDVDQENKCMGIDGGHLANSAVSEEKAKQEAEQKARDDIAAKMSGSFDALASAAIAKAETLDNNAATIASLTKTIAELTATNKALVNQLAAARTTATPSAPALPKNTQHHRILGVISPTGNRTNTAGVSCAAVIRQDNGKCYFLSPQPCNICGKEAVLHIPENCPKAEHNLAWKKEKEATAATKTGNA